MMTASLEPLRQRDFRRIWIASLFCNSGYQIQNVAAAWIMAQLTSAPEQVALVQTASMLPMMLLALPGGALADIYDVRRTAIASLLLSFCGALALALLAVTGTVEPVLVLTCCFIVGTGVALFTPAWAASVMELAGSKALPAGVALNSMSNNLARSVGPTAGGIALMTLGIPATFGMNAVLFLPMLFALQLWRRPHTPSKLGRENLVRAAFSGLRYAAFSPAIRRLLARAALLAFATSAVYALLPLVARVVLGGGAGTYGVLLGALGCGGVAFAFLSGTWRSRLGAERTVRLHSCVQGLAVLVLAFSPYVALSAVALFLIGGCWITNNSIFNVSISMASPRWVAGRLLALFYAPVAAGIGIGSWMWGNVASSMDIGPTLVLAGILLLLSPLLGIAMRLPPTADAEARSVPATTSVDVAMEIDGRSGPIALEIVYRIPEERSADFYALVHRLRRYRARNGAFGVSLSCDIADPTVWTERCHYPTWDDYVRARDRPTQIERDLQAEVNALHFGSEPIRVRRLLERPYGSLPRNGDSAERDAELQYPGGPGAS